MPLRAGTSRPDRARQPDTRFDWSDRDTWRPAIEGVRAAYIVRPDLEAAPELIADFARVAAGVHLVLLSEQSADVLPADHWSSRVEEAVTSATDDWTIVRPSWFHQVLTDPRYYRDAIAQQGVLPLPSGGGRMAFIDAEDIAAVVAAALLAPDAHRGKAYTLTGPDALTVADVAELLSDELGRPVRAEDPDPAGASDDPWLSSIFVDVTERVRDGPFEPVTDDVPAVIGRPPRSMAEFIAEHRDEFTG